MDQNSTRTFRSRKARAILAGGLVLGVGAVFTLAAWTDNEWVFGQNDNGTAGPGTQVYHMEQNTWTGASGAAAWSSQGSKNGGALTFTVNANQLVPGAVVYAPMELRAAAGSQALTALLAEGVQAIPTAEPTNSPSLYAALTYSVKSGVTKAQCNAAGFAAAGTTLVAAGQPLTATSSTPISLPAGASGAAGTPVDICFALSLPSTTDTTLQGKETTPLWRFTSTVGS
ncbi:MULTISPECIES: SipW-dependent-type signal peptide-containing protein [Arthrobacter]|uniref:SipW-dependent-type signal peptide-containing protein n=2 Tax=Arthrobacter TaxID=1663 RepID=A0ABU9KK57_9MICC|nr:SipW-dependent-type signal peptide-containing protein [Arthrobacter sp. YJM1]MDP5226479.1 SipW-dependent-type signal peptide-containing protein [Arthrobacter sp. YJM1]